MSKTLQKRTKYVRTMRTKDTKANESKDQLHILPGSSEYNHMLEDKLENSPKKKDDEVHVELEKHNEQLPRRNDKKSTKKQALDNVNRHKLLENETHELIKRSQDMLNKYEEAPTKLPNIPKNDTKEGAYDMEMVPKHLRKYL